MNDRRKAEAQRQPWPQEPAYDEPAYDERHWGEDAYEEPCDEPMKDFRPARETPPEIIATNRTVLLTCTLAAMVGLLGVFLCFAEKRSRAIRHFAGQSAALFAAHVILAAALLLIGSLLGAIPLLGLIVSAVCWLVYIAAVIVMAVIRIRMMFFAYQGIRFTLPMIGESVADRMGV